MPTRTQSRSSNRSNSSESEDRTRGRSRESRGAFSWSENAGPIIAAESPERPSASPPIIGRKALMQGMEAAIGDWDEILAAEHDDGACAVRQDAGDRRDADVQAQDAPDETLPMRSTSMRTKRRWWSILRCGKQTKRVTPTISKASMAM